MSDERNESLAQVEIFVLSLILIVAILGNGLMLIALRRQLQYRPMSRMYFFMLNLSIADLLVALGNILPQLAWDITFRFRGPDLLCRLIKFLQTFVLYLSTYVLTSMAVDRYLVVCHHNFSRNHYTGIRGPKILVALSWALSFIFALPQVLIFSQAEIKSGVFDCWTFLSPLGLKLYVTWFVSSVFILPLLVIGFSYGAICVKVIGFNLPNESVKEEVSFEFSKESSGGDYLNNKTSFSSSSTQQTRVENLSEPGNSHIILKQKRGTECRALKRQVSAAKIKTLKLTLVVVICFFLCWAPFCIAQLIMVYNPSAPIGSLYVILLLLASLNSCTNPWIYLAFSESLCNQLRICLRIGLRRGSDEESIGDEQEERVEPLHNNFNLKPKRNENELL